MAKTVGLPPDWGQSESAQQMVAFRRATGRFITGRNRV